MTTPLPPMTYDEKYGDGSGPEHVICPVCGGCLHCRDCLGDYCTDEVRDKCPAKEKE